MSQPAFPSPNNVRVGDFVTGGHPGMTLRDYFAAAALQGAMAHGLFNADKGTKSYAEYLSAISYIYADEMMKARER